MDNAWEDVFVDLDRTYEMKEYILGYNQLGEHIYNLTLADF